MRLWRIASCRSTASRMAARSRSQSAVLPSITVNRKETVPRGRSDIVRLPQCVRQFGVVQNGDRSKPGRGVAGLAHASGSGQREQTAIVPVELNTDLGDFPLPAQGGGW